MGFDYDVVVVGARVAGASTAMLLARRGHQVLLVDRSPMPSDTVSTHAITRSGVLQLKRWGLLDEVAAVTEPIRDIVLGFGSERVAFDVKPEFGIEAFYAPRRHQLDSLLVTAAERAGVTFRDRVTVSDLARSPEGNVNGVVANGQTITSRLVIGADGVWSRVARLVEAKEYQGHGPMNAVSYAYYTGIDGPGFKFQFTTGINAGLITTSEGAVCVFVGRPAEDYHRFVDDPEDEFERLIAMAAPDLYETVAAGTRVTPFRGTRGLPGFLRHPWGPGWALVGDAGYTKDPISAHGISDAFRDAELCARAADRALSAPAEASEAFSGYQRVRDQLSSPMLAESRALAGYGWNASEASRRMRAISDLVRDECEMLASLPDWSAAGVLVAS